MRISHLIFLSFTFILLLFAFTTYINYRQSERVKENSEFFSQSTSNVQLSNRFQRNILNMVSGLRGFLLTGENYFLQAYDSAATENKSILKDLPSRYPEASGQYILLKEIDTIHNRWLNGFATPLKQAKINAEASDRYQDYFEQLYKEKMFISEESRLNILLQRKIREFNNLEYAEREDRRQKLTQSVQETRTISFTLTTLSIIIGFSIVSFLVYRISKRITTMVKMANNIAAGNYQVHTEDQGKDELAELAQSLNHMARVLSFNINQLKRKNEELDQFAHIVSHDMKAPLRGIDNVVSWIEEDHEKELTPKVSEYMQLIKGRVVRGENLIQGLLAYARTGKEEHNKEEINTRQLVEEILENYTKSQMKICVSEDLPVIYSERIPLFQVFSNLIGNAIKYNDKEHGEVKVYHKEFPGHYRFFIEDNGPGISRNHYEKIFIIFQTLQERDSFESTGVGLAIVKKILDARNEKIDIESEVGKGTIFSFTWKK
jgi:signal transduction histidine kinase